MNFNKALPIAQKYANLLKPHCKYNYISIAGGLRRRKPDVHDIEIVCIPHIFETKDLFGVVHATEHCHEFAKAIMSFGKIVKGDPITGKMIQIELPEGITLDLFTATEENWGWIYLLRTGSADFNQKMLYWLREKGITSNEGYLHGPERISTKTERDVFELA